MTARARTATTRVPWEVRIEGGLDQVDAGVTSELIPFGGRQKTSFASGVRCKPRQCHFVSAANIPRGSGGGVAVRCIQGLRRTAPIESSRFETPQIQAPQGRSLARRRVRMRAEPVIDERLSDSLLLSVSSAQRRA